jgi:hypothetical protein
MGTGIGISPSVMINRMAHEQMPAQGLHLMEVARLRVELSEAQAEEKLDARPDPISRTVANGAEVVDLLA